AKRIDALSASLRRKKDFAFISALRQKYPSVEVYLVGGIIRDTLLKRNSKDYDFVVRNTPLRALQRVLKPLGTVNLVGRIITQ
ncbi:MAG: tRNA nucleotidyltransferase/poly(A) polymerase family protein, partial [Parcubacteria group bacterium GW2011_GWC2_49_9]